MVMVLQQIARAEIPDVRIQRPRTRVSAGTARTTIYWRGCTAFILRPGRAATLVRMGSDHQSWIAGIDKIQTPKGTAVMTYCSTIDGNPVFEVSGRKVRFNRLQGPGNGLVVYDVWWLSPQNEQTGSPETWKLWAIRP